MRVIELPASLDFQTLDALLAKVVGAGGEKVMFDGRHLRWVGPNGMVGLLAAGSVAQDRSGEAPILELGAAGDVKSYLGRMGFFQAADGIFGAGTAFPRRPSGPSDVLLEITPITTNSDVHEVVDRVQKRAGAILSKTLGYPPTSVVQFSVILSEVCQNILEHADAPVLNTYSMPEFRRLLDGFGEVRIVPERFPVPSRLHKGWKGALYNGLFVGMFNAIPRSLVRRFGGHLMAFGRT